MKKIILSCLFAFALAACEDLTDINVNPKATEDVPYSTLFSNAQVELSDILTNSDVNYNIFRLYAQQWTQVTYTDESNYDLVTRSIPDNFWDKIYLDVLRDLKEANTVIETVDEVYLKPGQKANEKAVIDIVAVYAWSSLMQVFGDIPYDQGLNIDNLLPSYTNDEEIHADLISRLNTDIAALAANPDVVSFPDADLLFDGDTGMWLRFANSLKLRLGMLIADSNPAEAQSIVESIDLAMLIDENEYNADFAYLSAPPYTNPVWEDLVQSGRNDYVPANTIVDIMNNLNDPRRDNYFTLLNDSVYLGDEYASGTSYASVSHIADPLKETTYPGMLLSAPEVNFYMAEAAARGWNVGGTLADYYNKAVTQSIIQYNGTEEEANAYLAQADVALTGTTWAEEDVQKKIGTQSWLALYNRGLEAWTQWRRTDYPMFNVPEGITYEDIPVRFTYPVNEQNLNTANYDEAARSIGGDLVTTSLFWDVN